MTPQHDEHAFEVAIEASLLSQGGYVKVDPVGFDAERGVFPQEFLAFVEASQPETYAKLKDVHKERAPVVVMDALVKMLDSQGSLAILRRGFKVSGQKIHCAFYRPETSLNPETERLYQANRVGVARQVRFSTTSGESVDLVLTVNGIPVVTAELKNELTGQTVEHAKQQYVSTRDPAHALFQPGKRALVHFAVDPYLVYMTTKLDKGKTRFLPFNKGHDGGAGNPPAPEGRHRTAYLWEEVWQRDSLLDILKRFVHHEIEEIQTGTKTVKREKLIFPRYHQLDAVRRLIATAREEGPGRNYLVQHSAGSGKSNSIAWLAHRLASLHDESDKKVFHTTVVVTDRRVLDQQLQDTIYQFEHKDGVVEPIDKDSNQLARALEAGTPIIITTLQKFPHVQEKIQALPDRNYAVIVDEAHSSQTGESAHQMKSLLAAGSLEEAAREEDHAAAPTWEDVVAENAQARGPQKNLSFFAFTATPKAKTLEVFGRRDDAGKPRPFHLYTMRQAIEEGFILDVLQNYTTYKAYYRLIKSIEDDPQVKKRKAAQALARFMSLHPHNIAQRVEVIVEHFRRHTARKIGGRAKAMVVTASRLHAVRYKEAIDRYIQEKKYTDVAALVAFSGTVKDPDAGTEHTESAMNKGVPQRELPRVFATDDYQVLIVANKYLTGFDQPLLHTMYVDKRLQGVHAVQTLSRLNRIHPGKTDTFILDFVNTHDEIRQAFQPFYEQTTVEETVDPQHLYQLQAELDDSRVYTQAEVDNFCKAFYDPKQATSGASHAKLYHHLDPAKDRYEALDEEEREKFRNRLKGFLNLYSFVSQIVPFHDSDLEKLNSFGRFLWRIIPKRPTGPQYAFDDEVALKYYRLEKTAEGAIQLQKGEKAPLKSPTEVGTSNVEDPEAPLSSLIEIINEKFGTDFGPGDLLFIEQIKEDAIANEGLQQSALANTPENFKLALDKTLEDLFIDRMDQNETIFAKFMDDPQFRRFLGEYLLKAVYEGIHAASEKQDGETEA